MLTRLDDLLFFYHFRKGSKDQEDCLGEDALLSMNRLDEHQWHVLPAIALAAGELLSITMLTEFQESIAIRSASDPLLFPQEIAVASVEHLQLFHPASFTT
jgi:hypothetical protein